MARSVSDLRRFTIAATDGNLAQVGDVCFEKGRARSGLGRG